MAQDNSINSIIPRQAMRLKLWEQLDDSEPLVQLHRKFWLEGEYGNRLLNVHEDKGPYKDEDTEEDDDNDTRSSRYVLDLGMDIGCTKVWVRKEYIRMYKYCSDHLEANRYEESPPSVVITGQPGIGKSYWILYAICQRLAQRKPTMWYYGKRLHLFVNEGVFMGPSDYPSTWFKSRVWTLVDADEGTMIPTCLAVHDTQNLIVFTSAPEAARWKGLKKTTNCAVAVMNPWTRGEISKAAAIHGFAANDPRIDEMYSQFGPIPRICFDVLNNPARQVMHESGITAALEQLSSAPLHAMVHVADHFGMDEASRTILLMKRNGNDLSQPNTIVEPITPAIETALQNQLRKATQAELLTIYRSLAEIEGNEHLAGVVYELLAPENAIVRITPYLFGTSLASGKGKSSGSPEELPNLEGTFQSSVEEFITF